MAGNHTSTQQPASRRRARHLIKIAPVNRHPASLTNVKRQLCPTLTSAAWRRLNTEWTMHLATRRIAPATTRIHSAFGTDPTQASSLITDRRSATRALTIVSVLFVRAYQHSKLIVTGDDKPNQHEPVIFAIEDPKSESGDERTTPRTRPMATTKAPETAEAASDSEWTVWG